MKIAFPRQIFENYSTIKFCKDPSSGSRVVPCGWTDVKTLIVALRNIANSPKNTLLAKVMVTEVPFPEGTAGEM
jgi:hypothetical protein